ADFDWLDYVFIGVSTAGTIAGMSRRLKERYPKVRIIAVDSEGSVIFGGKPRKRHIPGVGSSIVPPLLSHALIDDVVLIPEYETVFELIRVHRADCMDVVRDAYLAHARGQSVNPDSYFLRFPEKPDCRIIALPAYLGDGFHVAGLKWIASYPGNVQRGFPRASAVLVLNSYDTGYPFAILESSNISAARTAASAALAAYWLNGRSRRAQGLGIVGTGFIARYVYDFLVDTGWEIEDVRLYDTSPLESEKFRD